MPPLPPAENVLRLIPRFTVNGREVLNVMHYLMPAGKTPEAMQGLAEVFQNTFEQQVLGMLSWSLFYVRTDVIDLSAAPLGSISRNIQTPPRGGATTDALPNNVAAVVSLRTAMRGRSYRGRVYVPGMAEGRVSGNSLDAATVSGLQDGFGHLMDLSGGVGGPRAQLCVLSYWQNHALRGTPAATPVTSVAVNPRVDSQRRRLGR